MLASYVLSFTVVPAFARYLLHRTHEHHGPPRGFFGAFDRGFDRFRDGYGRLLERRSAPSHVRAGLRRCCCSW